MIKVNLCFYKTLPIRLWHELASASHMELPAYYCQNSFSINPCGWPWNKHVYADTLIFKILFTIFEALPFSFAFYLSKRALVLSLTVYLRIVDIQIMVGILNFYLFFLPLEWTKVKSRSYGWFLWWRSDHLDSLTMFLWFTEQYCFTRALISCRINT